jgi:hypothetical protein
MNIPITVAALALLTVVMILVTIFWLRIPPQIRLFLICASVVLVVVQLLFTATKWSTTSDKLNEVINWLAIAGYELIVLRFTRVPPKWLVIPIATILLLPLISASIMLPLRELFEPGSRPIVSMDDHLFYEISTWENSGGGNAGVDIIIYHRAPLIPFLRHKLLDIPFNNQECNSYAAFAISLPAKHYLGRCPYWPGQSAGTFDKLYPVP